MEVTEELIKDTMDLLAAAMIAEDLSISNTQALAGFLASRTGSLLYDEESKLWWDGPAAIAEMYEEEISGEREDCPELEVHPE